MASPANQEPNSSNYSLTIQRQQQELVKLLTQHFHRQFYQLAANNSSGNNSPSASVQQAPNHTHHHQLQVNQAAALTSASTFQQQQSENQQRIHHYQSNPNLLCSSGFNLTNSINLAAAAAAAAAATNHNNGNNQYQQQLHNQILRSHPPVSSSSNNNTGTPTNLSSAEAALPCNSLIDYTLRSGLNPYFYNALGLTTNDQLILSTLQQQQQQQQQQPSSIQAPNYNSRLHDLRELLDEREADEQNKRLSRRNSSDMNILDHEEDNYQYHQQHKSEGKGMLKFSINTILGNGSSQHLNNNLQEQSRKQSSSPKQLVPDTSEQNIQQGQQLDNAPSTTSSLSNVIRREDEGEQQLLDVSNDLLDCDQSESCSDSSSINASTPKTPQDTNNSNSILFNSQLLASNYHSATNSINQIHDSSASSLITNGNRQQHSSIAALRSNQAQSRHFTLPYINGSAAFPWTVATRGKPRRGMMRRAVFSDSQRVGLEKRFQLQKYISKPDRKKLAEKLGLRDSQVKIWFQNRRMKWRNSKERELLSAGGSREQTLPTRNNPNPDLSDVGETIKRLTTNSGNGNSSVNGKQVN